jgi:hypothetical protein
VTSAALLADVQQSRTRALTAAVARRLAGLWGLVDASDLTGSWATLSPAALQVLAAAQALAVLQADEYLGAAAGDGPGLDPLGWAGVAADGQSLAGLLALPLITTKRGIAAGLDVPSALRRGQAQLEMIGRTETADAGRTATGAGITARPKVYGSVRVVNPPACGRCVVLAGRVYGWSTGFQRHPHCDCGMAPAGSPEAHAAKEPRELWESMSLAQQNASAGSKADAQAIRDGADISRVINALRGMYTAAGRRLTTEGVRQRHGGLRLRPEQIYREAAGDRAEAIRLLRRFGYLL